MKPQIDYAPKSTIYLAHSASEKERGKLAQKEIESHGIIVYNPFDKHPEIREVWEKRDNRDYSWSLGLNKEMNETIVNSDLYGINISDALFMLYPDGPTIGIPCEMMYGWIHGKELHAMVPRRYKGHPWINHMCKVYPKTEHTYHCIDDLINAYKKTRPWLGDKPMDYCDWKGCSKSYQNDPGQCNIASSGENCHTIHPWDDREVIESYRGEMSDEEWTEYMFDNTGYERYVSKWNWWHGVEEQ